MMQGEEDEIEELLEEEETAEEASLTGTQLFPREQQRCVGLAGRVSGVGGWSFSAAQSRGWVQDGQG